MTRLYLNNYETLLTKPVLAGDLTIEVGTPPPVLAAGDFYRLSLIQRDANGVIVKLEFVDVTDVTGSTLTVTRSAEGTTPATFDINDKVQLDSTAQSYAPKVTDRAVIYTDSVAEGLFEELPNQGNACFIANGWHEDSNIGGGDFIYEPSVLKSEHNGGTIVSPTVPPVSAQPGASLAERTLNFLAAVGETDPSGSGVFVRRAGGVTLLEDFGLQNPLADSEVEAILGHVIASGVTDLSFYHDNYQCAALNLVVLSENLRLTGRPTTITLTESDFLPSAQTRTFTTAGVYFSPRAEGVIFNGISGNYEINGRFRVSNHRTDVQPCFDFSHFSGQGVSPVIGGTLHNYTDGEGFRIDNVGSGAALVLKNANNPLRRSDKPAGYVGEGSLIEGRNNTDTLFYFDKDGGIRWTGKGSPQVGGGVYLRQEKADNGFYAFSFSTAFSHAAVLSIDAFSFERISAGGVSKGRARLTSKTSAAKGLEVRAGAGDMVISSADGLVQIKDLPVYVDNAAAILGGLIADNIYKTASGELRIVV